jgi:hypothetical protein
MYRLKIITACEFIAGRRIERPQAEVALALRPLYR